MVVDPDEAVPLDADDAGTVPLDADGKDDEAESDPSIIDRVKSYYRTVFSQARY